MRGSDTLLLQRSGFDQPRRRMFDEHDVLVGNVLLLENPAQPAEEVLRFLDLRRVEDDQRVTINNSASRAWRRPRTMPRRMSLGGALRIASEARVKNLSQSRPVIAGEHLLALG